MSIYPVHLAPWFAGDKEMISTLKSLCCVVPCARCGRKVKWNRAWGHHSIADGVGDLWCGETCAFGGPVVEEL